MSQPLTTELVEAESRLELDAAEIVVTAGPDKGLKVELGTDSLLVGSAPTCNLVLHDPTVSSRHLEIVAGQSGYVVRDLKSKNGILLGNFPVERAPLCDGMRLRIGETVLTVRARGERRSIPLSRSGKFGNLVAHSVKMRAAVSALEQLGQSDVTVLLEGETGTGKEVAAEALHKASTRKNGPFVIFDCGAVTASLVAAELFGSERGAFTGADVTRPGLFEEADGGTLFLDEIGELPLELQPTLLGAIERKTSRRVGGRADIRHDVRIVCATNRNLAEEVRERRFREDLFFRLAVARVRLPPLRERPEDLPILAEMFATEAGGNLSSAALDLLAAHDWPGNVRELRNTVHYLVARPDAGAESIPRGPANDPDLFEDGGALRPLPEARNRANERFEDRYVKTALALAHGNVTRAAELSGIARQTFSALAQKHRK